MSKIALTPDASGTGTFTIASPNSNTNRTLTLPDGSGTLATAESTLSQFNATGDAPVYACRAWVNFNGTGTVAIRASGNVSSITDLGTGRYQINFINSLPDSNYVSQITNSLDGTYGLSGTLKISQVENIGTMLTTSCVVGTASNSSNLAVDSTVMCVAIFR